MAIRYGASAIGLVSAMPSGPGVIPETQITRIAAQIPPGISSFLLTSANDSQRIIAQQRRCGTSVLQICDRLQQGSYEDIRKALPGIRLVQVIHVRDEDSFQEALQIAPDVHALLLDSGNQDIAVKELGGTGRTHNWELSAKIRESVSIPVFLAGGLHPDNVAMAIRTVHPFGIDVCSGLRTGGKLNEAKLQAFMDAVASAGCAPVVTGKV